MAGRERGIARERERERERGREAERREGGDCHNKSGATCLGAGNQGLQHIDRRVGVVAAHLRFVTVLRFSLLSLSLPYHPLQRYHHCN